MPLSIFWGLCRASGRGHVIVAGKVSWDRERMVGWEGCLYFWGLSLTQTHYQIDDMTQISGTVGESRPPLTHLVLRYKYTVLVSPVLSPDEFQRRNSRSMGVAEDPRISNLNLGIFILSLLHSRHTPRMLPWFPLAYVGYRPFGIQVHRLPQFCRQEFHLSTVEAHSIIAKYSITSWNFTNLTCVFSSSAWLQPQVDRFTAKSPEGSLFYIYWLGWGL